jgi:hypothetical protein
MQLLRDRVKEKKGNLQKVLNEHHKVAIEGHIRVFFLAQFVSKKCFVRCRRRHIRMFGSFSNTALKT